MPETMTEILCAAGDNVQAELRDWTQRIWEQEHVFTPANVEMVQAVCSRPFVCQLRQFCTGKVECNRPEDNGMNKLTVSKVILYNRISLAFFKESFL